MLFILLLAVLPAAVFTDDLIAACVDVQGVKHKLDDSYIGPDGCNICKCMVAGSGCTKRFCESTAPKVEAEFSKCVDNKGNVHEVGQTYTHVDGCNTCQCMEFGGACTKKFCFKLPQGSKLCVDPKGNAKQPGETWMAADNCNKCNCGVLGAVCTMTKCIGMPEKKMGGDNKIGAPASEAGDSPCRYNGLVKMPGDSWLTEDDCNICTCTGVDGREECTHLGCRARFMKLVGANPEQSKKGNSASTMTVSVTALSFMLYIFFI